MRKDVFLPGAFACLASLACGACSSNAGTSEPSTASQSPASSAGAGGGAPGASTTPPSGAPANSAPASGSFGGTYSVPVPAELAAAATYDVTELNWIVSNGTATLTYNLPRALVGKAVRVDFTGPFDPATGHATLTGPAGTSECTVTAATVSCAETMRGLLPLNSDLAVVEKLAASFPGPSSFRVIVAQRFEGDPIGIAQIDLHRPGVPEPVEVETEQHGKK